MVIGGPGPRSYAPCVASRCRTNEADLYRRCTGRTTLPSKPFREAWVAVGRKGRKSATAGALAVYCAVYGQWKRAPGETLRVVVIALSKDQAKLVLARDCGIRIEPSR